MQQLTDQGWQQINALAQRYAVSSDAVLSLLQSVVNGNGSMAQFHHPELGGGGQWMRGGMTMVGDMFNHGLKAKVDGLCNELSQLLAQQPFVPEVPVGQAHWQGGGAASLFVPPASGGYRSWYPSDLGVPSSTGGQNNSRYAYFPGTRRLAVEINGQVTVYDTLDHQIGGVSQQQGSGSLLTFTSQYGTVPVASLPIVSPEWSTPSPPSEPPRYATTPTSGQESDIVAMIERLADLRQKGILSAEEFAAKKAELLARL